MKSIKLLIGLILLFFGFLCQAQDQVLFNVTYEFKYVRDLTDKENPYTDKMVLSVGKNSSRYTSEKMYDRVDTKRKAEKADAEKVAGQGLVPKVMVSGKPLLLVSNNGVDINEQISKDFENKKLTAWGSMGPKDYKTETALPQIEWQIFDEKKTIGNYNCQKATGSYGGRSYTAWFAQDLPLPDGPWKLSGLPGLILEAIDSRNELIFNFVEISKTDDEAETTASIFEYEEQYTVETNLAGYNRIKKAYETDPESVWSAAYPDAKLSISNSNNPKASRPKTIKKYNPMELKLK